MTSSSEIRAMRWWDVQAVLAIEEDLFPLDPWSGEMFWAELAQVPDSREVVVIENEGELAGYASLRVAGADGDVNTIAVAAQFQGKGFGRALMDWFIQRFSARNVEQAFLEVRSDHSRARALYSSYGFEDIDVRKDYYGNEVDAIIMRRKVKQ